MIQINDSQKLFQKMIHKNYSQMWFRKIIHKNESYKNDAQNGFTKIIPKKDLQKIHKYDSQRLIKKIFTTLQNTTNFFARL